MDDILDQIQDWVRSGHALAMATVVSTWGSAPRAVGARMAVRDDGSMTGSVSGGCVEGAVVQEALKVLKSGSPRLLHYGVTDETAWEVGLACGGSIEVFVQPYRSELLNTIGEGYAGRRALCEATVIQGPDPLIGQTALFDARGFVAGDWGDDLSAGTEAVIAEALTGGQPARAKVEMTGTPLEIFINVFLPSPTLIMIGGVHISMALSRLANALGYRTIVIDPRKSFATSERFPETDELIQRWPQEGMEAVGIDANTAIAALTHDPKIDDPALLSALRSSAFYIGALGSRATHAKRVERLQAEGLKGEEIARIKAPIGLDLGGRTPEEIALSILAEIAATRYGRKLVTP